MDGTILPGARGARRTGDDRLADAALRGHRGVAGRGRLRDLFQASTNPSVAYLASSGEVKVRLTAKAPTAGEAGAMIAPLVEEVRARLGDVVFTVDDEKLEEAVARLLGLRGRTRRVRGVAHRRGVGPADRRPGRLEVLPRLGGRLHRGGEARRAGRVAGDDRRPGVVSEACALEMAAASGACSAPTSASRSPASRARSRTEAPSRDGMDRPRRRRRGARARATSRRASAPGASVGGAGRRSIWCVATSRAAAAGQRHV